MLSLQRPTVPPLTIDHRERISTALRFATAKATLFVFVDALERREEVKALAAGHGYSVYNGAWHLVARALAHEGVTNYAHVLDVPCFVTDVETAARFAANHPHPALLIASSVHAPELRRSNAWERRAFTLDLTSST